jgi:gluconolactonase
MLPLALAALLLLADDPKPTPPAIAPPPGLLPDGAAPVRLCSGHKFTEGPLWVKDDSKAGGAGGALLFSDIPADAVYRWTPPADGSLKESKAEVFIQGSGLSNGLCLDPATGDLLLAQHAGSVARLGPDAALRTLASTFEGKSLNSPNDLCVAPGGAILFTDPGYGLRGGLAKKGRTKELDFQGVYRLDKNGTLTPLARDLPSPNGLALSPDHATLYVADTGAGKLHAFTFKPDGTLENPRVLATGVAGADGVKVDTAGRIYVAAGSGPTAGAWVFSPAGERLGIIPTPEKPTNLCFGGPDNSTLFLTTGRSVFAVRTTATGEVKPGVLKANPPRAEKDPAPAPANTPAATPAPAPDAPKK